VNAENTMAEEIDTNPYAGSIRWDGWQRFSHEQEPDNGIRSCDRGECPLALNLLCIVALHDFY
jgi:hypothetical protein